MNGKREQARKECEALVATLEIPEPFDLQSLCHRVGEMRGRAVVLMPTAMTFGNLCGLWLATARTDYVFYEKHTTVLHQRHIVFHELGHILRGHVASRTLGADIARALTSAIEPGQMDRVLGRDSYTDDQEREAELIGTLILKRVSRLHSVDTPSAVDPAAGGAIARIARSLSRGDRS